MECTLCKTQSSVTTKVKLDKLLGQAKVITTATFSTKALSHTPNFQLTSIVVNQMQLCPVCYKSVQEVAKTIDAMHGNVPNPKNNFCLKCFSPTRQLRDVSHVQRLSLLFFNYEASPGAKICSDCSTQILCVAKTMISMNETIN